MNEFCSKFEILTNDDMNCIIDIKCSSEDEEFACFFRDFLEAGVLHLVSECGNVIRM